MVDYALRANPPYTQPNLHSGCQLDPAVKPRDDTVTSILSSSGFDRFYADTALAQCAFDAEDNAAGF